MHANSDTSEVEEDQLMSQMNGHLYKRLTPCGVSMVLTERKFAERLSQAIY